MKINLEIILLDDAFQHRKIQPNLNILLTDFKRLFYEDTLLPAGRLRESKSGAKRADAVIISKCPENLAENEKQKIILIIKKITKNETPIFFSKITYKKPVNYFDKNLQLLKAEHRPSEIKLISAIAQPQIFEDFLKEKYQISNHFVFPDHHFFTRNELKKILQNTDNQIVTTEKDFVKAKHTIYCNSQFATYIELPVMVKE